MVYPSSAMANSQQMNTFMFCVGSLKAYVGSHGCIPQVSLGSYEVCKCPGMSQGNLLPQEGNDLGYAGNWKTSGSYSSEPSHCDSFHQRSLDFVFQLESSLWSGCCVSFADSVTQTLQWDMVRVQWSPNSSPAVESWGCCWWCVWHASTPPGTLPDVHTHPRVDSRLISHQTFQEGIVQVYQLPPTEHSSVYFGTFL